MQQPPPLSVDVTGPRYFGLDWRAGRKRTHDAAFGAEGDDTVAFPYALVQRLLSVPVLAALGARRGDTVAVGRWGCVTEGKSYRPHDWRAVLDADRAAEADPGATLFATVEGMSTRPSALHVGQARVTWLLPDTRRRVIRARLRGLDAPRECVLREWHAQELVIDLDLGDSPLRAALCDCRGKQCCATCWLLLELGALATEAALEQLVGAAPRALWVFSGGRGVHAWFATPRACTLSHAARDALAGTFASWKGDDAPAGAHVPRASAICGVPGTAWAAVERHWEAEAIDARDLLAARPDLRAYLLLLWSVATSKLLIPVVERLATTAPNAGARGTRSRAIWDYLCQHDTTRVARERLYARLALAHVDTGALDTRRRHLMRVPFSLHATSGYPALPLAVGAAELCARRFDPRAATAMGATPADMRAARAVAERWLAQFAPLPAER